MLIYNHTLNGWSFLINDYFTLFNKENKITGFRKCQ